MLDNPFDFVGTATLSLDGKNRLLIPAEIRRKLEAAGCGEALVAKIGPNGRLWLYPTLVYQELTRQQEATLEPGDDDVDFGLFHYAMAERLPIDGQGRILITRELLEESNTGTGVALLGNRDHFQLWNREEWDQKRRELHQQRRGLAKPKAE